MNYTCPKCNTGTKCGDHPAQPEPNVLIELALDAPDDTLARVNAIAEVMRAGLWIRGRTGRELAKAWGLSVSRVEDLSAEAWRRVCSEANDADAVRPTIAGTLATNLAAASAERKYGEVAKLADVYSRVIGARAPEARVEVPLTPEQARARYRELTGHDWPQPTEEKKP